MKPNECIVKSLGSIEYGASWKAMKEFTDARDENTTDELWIVNHPPVYTLGQAGKAEHLLEQTEIPVINTDRGGQITYHGPGQLVIYTLLNLKRRKLGIRALVSLLEKSVIALLNDYGIQAEADPKAPGIYINGAKICAIGLRVRRGCSFHGLALNVDMDLSPFESINPCGYPGMKVTQLKALNPHVKIETVSKELVAHLLSNLAHNSTAKEVR